MIMTFDVTVTGLDKRTMARAQKTAMRLMLWEWLHRYFEGHFKRSALSRYPGVYRERAAFEDLPEFIQQKIERTGGRHNVQVPNVLTGRMRRELKETFRVSGSAKLMTATMRGPSYTVTKGGRGPFGMGGFEHRIDKPAEITFIRRREQEVLLKFLRRTMVRVINATRTTRKLRIR